MKIIGAGFPRTGTMSLKQALNTLGYNSYHMEEVPRNASKGHHTMWHEYMLGNAPMDWEKVFEEYDATVDFPAAYYYKELIEEYPSAKVILGIRDEEKWVKSIDMLTKFSHLLTKIKFPPIVARIGKMTTDQFDIVFGEWTKENFLKAYRKHNEEVQRVVPKEQLLVFNPKDGWQPLCEFLGKPIPDIPFPHANSGRGTLMLLLRKYLLKFTLQHPLFWIVCTILVGLIIWWLRF